MDQVHPHLARRDLGRERLREALERAVGGRNVRARVFAGLDHDERDAASAALAHAGQRGDAGVDRPAEPGVEYRPPAPVVQLAERDGVGGLGDDDQEVGRGVADRLPAVVCQRVCDARAHRAPAEDGEVAHTLTARSASDVITGCPGVSASSCTRSRTNA